MKKAVTDLIVNLVATWIAPYVIPYLDWTHVVALFEFVRSWLS